MRSTNLGLTLIEVMIKKAAVSVVASVAYKQVDERMMSANRAAVQAVMMDAVAKQQQRLLDVRSYADQIDALQLSVPPEVTRHYALAIETRSGADAGYAVVATPKGWQSNDPCGALTVDSSGSRSSSKAASSCW